MELGNIWKCHICGSTRPDAQTSVHTKMTTFSGIEVQENIRYCNDNPDCMEKAKSFSFLKKDKAEEKLLHISEVMESITNCLRGRDGKDLADIHNQLCGERKIEYLGNSGWRYTGEED